MVSKHRWSHITGTVYMHVEYTTMVIQKGGLLTEVCA